MTIEQDKFISILDEKAKEAGFLHFNDMLTRCKFIMTINKAIKAAAEQYKERGKAEVVSVIESECKKELKDCDDWIVQDSESEVQYRLMKYGFNHILGKLQQFKKSK